MTALFIHDDARADLEALYLAAPQAAAKIMVLLEEVSNDADLMDRLTDDHFGRRGHDDFNVRKWLDYWNKGRDLWRLRIWDAEQWGAQYRVIYAYIPGTGDHHVLAIAPREFNYERDHPITKRIIRAYDAL